MGERREFEVTWARCRLASSKKVCVEARTFITSRCRTCPAETLDVVRLLTCELVTNAMWHGPPGGIWLDVQTHRGLVRVGVTDAGTGEVGFAPTHRWPESGHGLRLVDALADRWGVERFVGQPGKRVWFEIAT